MPIPEKDDILYAAKKLSPYLGSELKMEVDEVVQKIAAGEKRPLDLIDLLAASGDFQRDWMQFALLGQMDETGARVLWGGATLPGGLNPIPADSVWVCSAEGCDFEWRVRRAGQPVPPCPKHKNALVRKP